MKLSTALNRENRGMVATVLVAAIFVPVLASVFGFALGPRGDDATAFLEMPTNAEACVEDTEYMRFYHMDLLKEVREDVIRRGDRSAGITLSGCATCHENRATFCNRCHEAVTLPLDCFGCHYYPDYASEGVPGHASEHAPGREGVGG